MGIKGERMDGPFPRVGPNQRVVSSTPADSGSGYSTAELRALLGPEAVIEEPPGRVLSPEVQGKVLDWWRSLFGDPSVPGTFDSAGRYYGATGEREPEPGTEGRGSRADVLVYLRLNPDALPGVRAKFRERTGRDLQPSDLAPLDPEGFGGSDFPALDGPGEDWEADLERERIEDGL